jgi:hypothetical protein
VRRRDNPSTFLRHVPALFRNLWHDLAAYWLPLTSPRWRNVRPLGQKPDIKTTPAP